MHKKDSFVSTLTCALALAVFVLLVATPELRAAGSGQKSGPGPDVALYNQGVSLLKRGDFATAQSRFESALEIREDFPEAHNNLAYSLRKQGEEHFEEALSHYNRALELDPDLAEARMYRGALHVLMDDKPAAEKDLEALRGLNGKLADELAWVIENGAEKADSLAGITW